MKKRLVSENSDFYYPLCNRCENLFRTKDIIAVCRAFPNGIPEDILTGEFDHTKKHPKQDNDIVFKPTKEK